MSFFILFLCPIVLQEWDSVDRLGKYNNDGSVLTINIKFEYIVLFFVCATLDYVTRINKKK